MGFLEWQIKGRWQQLRRRRILLCPGLKTTFCPQMAAQYIYPLCCHSFPRLFGWKLDKLAKEREKHEKTVIIKNLFDAGDFEVSLDLL